jgi:hypothetical protein
MNKKLYMKPSTNVKVIYDKEILLDGSGLKEQSDGTYTESSVTGGSSVKADNALSKRNNIWE